MDTYNIKFLEAAATLLPFLSPRDQKTAQEYLDTIAAAQGVNLSEAYEIGKAVYKEDNERREKSDPFNTATSFVLYVYYSGIAPGGEKRPVTFDEIPLEGKENAALIFNAYKNNGFNLRVTRILLETAAGEKIKAINFKSKSYR